MNYISEIRRFYAWLLFNTIPADAQALWHFLMNANNSCALRVNDAWYWRVWFDIPNTTIVSVLAFSAQQLNRMRNALIQSGRIEYKKGGGGRSGSYRMVPLDEALEARAVVDMNNGRSIQVWMQTEEAQISSNSHYVIRDVDNSKDNVDNFTKSHNVISSDSKYDSTLLTGMNEANNIMLPQVNSNAILNNNIYNTYSCGDDESIAHTREAAFPFPPEMDEYLGMTEDVKQRTLRVTRELFARYWNRPVTPGDVLKMYEHGALRGEDRRGVLSYALEEAALAGSTTWRYVEGILSKLRIRGITTREECETYDAQRDYEKEWGT